jgi:hypothetical protein
MGISIPAYFGKEKACQFVRSAGLERFSGSTFCEAEYAE